MILLLGPVLIGLTGCVAPQPAPLVALDTELAELVALYQGSYLSTPDQGARSNRPILLRVVPVAAPSGHSHALYSEMRHDGADGDIYRQRLLLFDEARDRNANTMTALAFDDPDAAAALIDQPELLVQGKLNPVSALVDGCQMQFVRHQRGFLGRIDPRACVITGKSGELRHIEGETLLRADAIEQLERGYDAQMRLKFGNPQGQRYVWPRLPEVE